jgi:hypothetical protein
MIQLVSKEQLARAAERARRSSLFVRLTSIRGMYRVENRENGNIYVVNFFVRKSDRTRWGHCTCLAGQNSQLCKHIAGAAALHVGLSAIRRRLQGAR